MFCHLFLSRVYISLNTVIDLNRDQSINIFSQKLNNLLAALFNEYLYGKGRQREREIYYIYRLSAIFAI